MSLKSQIYDFTNRLIEEGEKVVTTKWQPQGYIIASGVILRAVLEERLKLLCDRNLCVPAKQRPTIVDYNTELYKKLVYDKLTMKLVESMAAVGNDAAHTNPQLSKDDVGRFKRDLFDFLQKFSK